MSRAAQRGRGAARVRPVFGVAAALAAALGTTATAAPATAARGRVAGARPTDVADPSTMLPLDGVWLFHAGDNPAFSQPTLDDRDWEQRQVPTSATPWTFRWHGYGWYRLHVAVSERALGADFALSVGRAREVAEVYVNGALVASRGRFGSRPRGGERLTPLSALLPATLVRAGDNVVAVRIYDPTWAGGLVAGPLVWGPPALVAERALGERASGPGLHLVLATLAFFIGVSHLLLSRGRWGNREGFWLAAAGAGLAVALLGGTGLLGGLPPVLELWLRLPSVGAAVAAFTLAAFFAIRYDDLRSVRVRAGAAGYAVLVAGLLVAPDAVAFWAASPLVLVASLVAALYAAYLLGQGARRQEPYTTPIFASVVVLALALVYDGLTASDASGLPPVSLAGALVVLAVTSLATVRQMLGEHEQALAALEAVQVRLEAERRVGLLDATALSITDGRAFLHEVVHEAARDLAVRRCSLVVAEGGELVIAAGVGLPKETTGKRVQKDGSIAGWVYTNGRSVTDKTLPEELNALRRAGRYATRAFISEPVLDPASGCVGVLNVSERLDAGDFAPEDAAAVTEVARKLAVVLRRLAA